MQTQLKTKTPSYSAEVELEGNEVNPWPYSCSIMQCKLCFPRETELAAYKYIDIALRKHVEGKYLHHCIGGKNEALTV